MKALILIVLLSLALPGFARVSDAEALKNCPELKEWKAKETELLKQCIKSHCKVTSPLFLKRQSLSRDIEIGCYQDKEFAQISETATSNTTYIPVIQQVPIFVPNFNRN